MSQIFRAKMRQAVADAGLLPQVPGGLDQCWVVHVKQPQRTKVLITWPVMSFASLRQQSSGGLHEGNVTFAIVKT